MTKLEGGLQGLQNMTLESQEGVSSLLDKHAKRKPEKLKNEIYVIINQY